MFPVVYPSSIRLYSAEKLLLALHRLAASRRHPRVLPQHLETGERGEEAALFHLRCAGFVIVARRWKNARYRGDIDLIAWEGDTLCFIEVKTRGGHAGPSAESAVDEDKRQMLRRLARVYLKMIEPPPESIRFDMVSVYVGGDRPGLLLFRGAFGWS